MSLFHHVSALDLTERRTPGGHPGITPCMPLTHLARASPCLLSSMFRSERKIPPSTVTCCFSLSTCKGWDGRGERKVTRLRRERPYRKHLLPMQLITSVNESHEPQGTRFILSCQFTQTFTQHKPRPTQWLGTEFPSTGSCLWSRLRSASGPPSLRGV